MMTIQVSDTFFHDLEKEKKEIYNQALEDFKNKLISDEFQKYNIDFVFETNREWDYSDCTTTLIDYVSEVYKQMKR